MVAIPNVNVDHLRHDFKARIDTDKASPLCIWCKSGKSRKHKLLDCPRAFPLPDQRTPFSNEVFGAGHEDAAVAYIHQLQREHNNRQDGLTPFNSGKLRYQISDTQDVTRSSSVASASAVPPSATAAPPVSAVAAPHVIAPVATASAPAANLSAALGGLNVSSSTRALPTTNSGAAAASTGPAPSAGSAIPIAYEDENVQPLQARNAPDVREMVRGGLIIKPKPDTKEKLSVLQTVKADFHTRESFVDAKGRVYTNHFQLTIQPDQKLYQYKIGSTLQGRNKRKIRALMKTTMDSYDFLKDHSAFFATNHFDTIVAWKPLHSSVGPQHHRIDGDGQNAGSAWMLQHQLQDGLTNIGITFIFEGMVDVASLLKHTNIGPNYASADLEPAKRALNIIVSKCFGETTSDMVQVGANKFFSKRGTNALRGSARQNSVSLCTMRGYYYTVKAGVRHVLLNVNPCTSAFFNNVRVSEVMRDTLTFNRWEVEGVLRGLRVHIELLRGDQNKPEAYERLNTPQARVKTIQGFGDLLRDQYFDDVNGVRHNVLIHLQNTYPNRTIRHPDLPAINLGSSLEPKWYAPEDLLIVPYQMYKSVVPTALTESMLETACLKPEEGAARVDVEALKALGIAPTENDARPLSQCSALTLDPRMLLVPSHQFSFPTIQYGIKAVEGRPWNLRGQTFYRTNKRVFRTLVLADRSVTGPTQALARNKFSDFADTMYGVATINFIGTHPLNDPKNASAIEHAIRKSNPDLVLLILGSRDVEAYSRFKDLTDRTFGCHSICMTGRIFDQGIAPKMANIMMKANLKAAGSNHTIRHGKLTEIMADTLMIDDIESMIVERIKDWVVINKFRLPRNIIYYRDGVSEGQYAAVRDEELSQIMSAFPRALQELKKEYHGKSFSGGLPKLTAIVCAKRHHVRFYPENGATNNGNCQPGTYVDDVVTSPYYADFYLQSHSPLQGTARPAHYFVLRNEMDRTVEELRQLTHELCFTYVRTTSAVSYASPAYYADRLCERGRCYLRDFLVTTQDGKTLRNDLKNFKRAEEKRLAARRKATYGAPGAGNARHTKEDAERVHELQDRKTVEDACTNHTMQKAKRVFYKNGPDRNPWSARIAHTMFWM
ncbi:uncharacterized protein EKO05_0007647 [Ascochyta rabiei]|uniref:uncharacterized protein n=1 Tax=Didymella rabiei TaxID=5454 RepID=UPI0018FF9653|nr:uncharacterized protein EKO05_0007647 [Ascochyta rabiei]UPX17281.1 hypothetical protein EKO05_0007647 [Ascochyta rabiei]